MRLQIVPVLLTLFGPLTPNKDAELSSNGATLGCFLVDVELVREKFQDEGVRLPAGSGMLVQRVVPGSPAAKAGLKQLDIIYKIDDTDVGSEESLRRWLAKAKPGRKYELHAKQAVEKPERIQWYAKRYEIIPEKRHNEKDALPKSGGFRGVEWGATPEDVRDAEKAELIRCDEDTCLFRGEVAGFDSTFGYIFLEQKLVRGAYTINERHTADIKYIADFDSLCKSLESKYGDPSARKTIWSNDLYRDDPENWGTAVAIGHLEKYAGWTLSDTQIDAMISGDNFSITVALIYTSLAHKHLLERREESRRTDGL